MRAQCEEGQRLRRGGGGASKCSLTLAALSLMLAISAGPAGAIGRLGDVEIIARNDARMLPVHTVGGSNWVVGTPGQEYAIRFCNRSAGRVLAVMSVDGVNAISGETASPAQSGYVLSPWECADIQGWRKSLARTAAFYFTEFPDAYATRTGRPENVGVIGVAIFRERPQPIAWKDRVGRIAAEKQRAASNEAGAAQPEAPLAQDSAEANAARGQPRRSNSPEAAASGMAMPAPAPLAKLGTGHGRSEESPVQIVRFERESATPSETIAIHYDRRENLIAMGILPPPYAARTPNPDPFPAWMRFAADPPPR
jgi:hypothetical protein